MTISPLMTSRSMLMATVFGIAMFVTPHHATTMTKGSFISTAQADDSLGREVGKHLQKAQELLSKKQPQKAMTEVNEAEATHNKTDYERYIIEQMKAAVATQARDTVATLKAYDTLLNNPRTPQSSKKQMLTAQASLAYSAQNYTAAEHAATRYLHEVGPDQSMQTLLVQCYYNQKNWMGVIQTLEKPLTTAKKTNSKISENLLQMLATSYGSLNRTSAQTDTYVQLVKAYPRPQYWQILIHNLVSDRSLSPRLVFNLQRLRLATGVLTNPADFQDMAERAVQIGLPQLALNLLNEGYNRHILGIGSNATQQEHFHSFVKQQAIKVHNELPVALQQTEHTSAADPILTTGYNLVLNGHVDQGITLIKKGLTKNPRFPQIAQLEAGMALMDGGRTHDAITSLNQINGDDTVCNLAQLWAVYLQNSRSH